MTLQQFAEHGLSSPRELLVLFAAILARLAPLVFVAPFFGGKLIPVTVRAALALALAVVMLPAISSGLAPLQSASTGYLTAVLVKEVLIGFALGFLLALVFYGIQAAGWLADTARGASMSEVMVPQSGVRSSAIGSLLFQLAIVLFFALGGHRIVVLAIARTYEVLPIGAFPPGRGLAAFAIFCGRLTGELFVIALSLAAPIVAAIFVADLSLGWINRFSPQLNVFFLAMPLKAALGIAVLALSLAGITAVIPEALALAVRQLDWAMRILAR
jgi:type III secretion protein SpaR/YscT/HrcT